MTELQLPAEEPVPGDGPGARPQPPQSTPPPVNGMPAGSAPVTAWRGSVDDLFRVLHEAGDGITVTDASGRLRFVNRSAATIMGFADPAEAMALSASEVLSRFELLDVEGRPLPGDRLPSRRALETPGHHEALVRFRLVATREERWSVVRSVSVRDAAGAVAFVVNTFQDVTALKETEDRLSLLADVGSILGRSVDHQGTLDELARLMVRRVADWCVLDIVEGDGRVRREAVAHADPARVRLAEEVRRRYPPDPRTSVTARVIETGEPILLAEVTDEDLVASATSATHAAMLRSLGLGSVLVLPLIARGQTLGAMSLVRSRGATPFSEAELPLMMEVARRAALATDNARLLTEATESVRLRDDFLAVVSHDMRTPLAAILGYVQLAQRRLKRPGAQPDEKLAEYLDAAERMSERLTGLVGELMDISLLRSGQPLPLEQDPIDLRDLVSGAIDARRKLNGHARFALELGSPAVVVGDRARLERVLDNLLDNAVKYSPEGATISVIVARSGPDATISVIDRGRGIPAEDQPLIFERYRRGSNAAGVRGTGMGLAGSRDVVRQLGGEISVTSEEGAGATFVVRLPLQQGPTASD